MRSPPPSPHRPGSPPSWQDPTVARASRAIGGPIGRYAATASTFWTPLRVLLALCAVTLMLGWAQKSPCANARWAHHSQYSQFCYSDILPLWSAEGLDQGQVPYRDHAVEYPVVVGGFMWLSAEVTRATSGLFDSRDRVVEFGVVSALLLALAGLATLGFTVGAAGRRPWDAAIFAASPLLIFHAYTNWDLVAMALTAAAMWAWARGQPELAGTLVGLGVAAKLYPGLLLLGIWVLAARTGRYRPAVRCTAFAVVAWLVVNLPIALPYYTGWKTFYVFSADRPAEASTLWQMGHYVRSVGLWGGNPSGWVPPGWAVAFVVLAALGYVAWLGFSAPVKPRLAQLMFLAVAAFLLTAKVWSPQYSLWLVPLLALARPRFRMSLLWQFSEITVWIVTCLWLATGSDAGTAASRGPTYGWLALVCLIRDGFVVTLCVLIVREMWHPELDVVRADGLDDPGGGPFDRASDLASSTARHAQRMEMARAAALHVAEVHPRPAPDDSGDDGVTPHSHSP